MLPTAWLVPAVICAAGAGYNLSLLAGAFSDDDEPDAAPSYFQLQAERRHCALMERYGQPVSLLAAEYRQEHRPETTVVEREQLSEAQVEAFARAAADARSSPSPTTTKEVSHETPREA